MSRQYADAAPDIAVAPPTPTVEGWSEPAGNAARLAGLGLASAPPPDDDAWVTSTDGVWLVADPAQYETSLLEKLPAGLVVAVLDRGPDQPFNDCTAAFQWWRVAAAGREGWVMASLLEPAASPESPVTPAPMPPDRWREHGMDLRPGEAEGGAKIRTNDDYGGTWDSEDAFELVYEGPDAERFHFVQFVWAEALVEVAPGQFVGLPQIRFDTNAGVYTSVEGGTQDAAPAGPTGARDVRADPGNWKDGAEGSETPGRVSVSDRPAFKRPSAEQVWAAHPGKRVMLRQHYEVFLVKLRGRSGEIVSHSAVEMAWDPILATEHTGNTAISVANRTTGRSLPEPYAATWEAERARGLPVL